MGVISLLRIGKCLNFSIYEFFFKQYSLKMLLKCIKMLFFFRGAAPDPAGGTSTLRGEA